VVTRAGERWLVVVSGPNATSGEYLVAMGGLPFQYVAAVPPDDASTIRDGLLQQLGAQVLASASPQGLTGILLQEVVPPPPALPTGLGVQVAGPAADTITATLVSGGDTNAADRARWLEAALCWIPDCRYVCYCGDDYAQMQAALAAHWIYSTKPANIGGAGGGANDFERMRLGPAELSRGQSAYGAGGAAADDMLARTVPGQYFLALRRKYIFPFVCV
jgi:hypothetical protein